MMAWWRGAAAVLVLAGCATVLPRPQVRRAPAITLAAAGDVLLGRRVGEAIDREGVTWPLAFTRPLLEEADLAFANLECPLAATSAALPKRIAFRADPKHARVLSLGGLDVVSLANNHALDCGRRGLEETFAALARHRVRWCGAGSTRRDAEAPCVVRCGGLAVAFVGFTQWLEGSRRYDAVPTHALAAEADVRRAMARARAAADVVVASFHWGREYDDLPTPFQRAMARHAVAAGADLVLGHHPHVLQGLEVVPRPGNGRKPALVAYSLGNFLFDQLREEARDSAVLRCTLSPAGVTSAWVVPIRIEDHRPRPADVREAERILGRLAEVTAPLGGALDGARVRL